MFAFDDNDDDKGIRRIGVKHPAVRQAIALMRNKSVIEHEDLFIVEGGWACEKIRLAKIQVVTMLICPEIVASDMERELIGQLVGYACETYYISEKVCRKISDRDDPEGCFLLCRLKERSLNQINLKKDNIIVILDGLERPGNIGTIIRTADAAGIDAVIVCNQKVKLTNYKLIKAAMGSSFFVPVISLYTDEAIGWLAQNDFKIFVTDLSAVKCFYEADFGGRVAIIAGNENRGISDRWRNCDYEKIERIIIPMFGGADSLNVGFAATLVIYEAAMRQRNIIRRPSVHNDN